MGVLPLTLHAAQVLPSDLNPHPELSVLRKVGKWERWEFYTVYSKINSHFRLSVLSVGDFHIEVS